MQERESTRARERERERERERKRVALFPCNVSNEQHDFVRTRIVVLLSMANCPSALQRERGETPVLPFVDASPPAEERTVAREWV